MYETRKVAIVALQVFYFLECNSVTLDVDKMTGDLYNHGRPLQALSCTRSHRMLPELAKPRSLSFRREIKASLGRPKESHHREMGLNGFRC